MLHKRSVWWSWISLLAAYSAGLLAVYRLLPVSPMFTCLHAFLAIFAVVTTSLVASSFIRFLCSGWHLRYEEIRNRLPDGRLHSYLLKFWPNRLKDRDETSTSDANKARDPPSQAKLDERTFNEIYTEQYGRSAFIVPFVLLAVTVFVEAVLIVLVRRGVLTLGGIEEPTLKTSVAAIAGAYMFVVSDTILSVRRRSLKSWDVYSYTLRMIVAVPIGSCISIFVAPQLGALLAFSVASLPVSELNKLVRRVSYQNLTKQEATQDSDELIRLEGVTVQISDDLAAEGVVSVDQLLGMDPVLLTIRTGLPFDLILRLAAQAITGRYLSGTLAAKLPLGLGDATAVFALVTQLKSADDRVQSRARAILEDAASRLFEGQAASASPEPKDVPKLPVETLKFQFARIAEDEYTQFLMCDSR